jgi:two-component system phosphate regulon response regulator PhoB
MSPAVLTVSTSVEFHLIAKHILEAEGFSAIYAQNPAEAVAAARSDKPLAVLLDCRSAGFPSQEICASIKADPETGAIVVIALIEQGAESVYLDLLKAGADRSFHRPFEPIKVLEYLRTIASIDRGSARSATLRHGDLELELASRRIWRAGNLVHVGAIEFNLLRALMENPREVLSREMLISAAWSTGATVDGRTVDVHIGLLRKALRQDGSQDIIQTMRGVGYSLDV